MKRTDVIVLSVLIILLVGVACSGGTANPTSTATTILPPTAEPAPPGGLDNPPAVSAALKATADMLGVDPAGLTVEQVLPVTWPDGCLGVHRRGVLCTQGISEGFAITLSLDGRFYQTNSNSDGSSIVQVPGAIASPGGAALTSQDGDNCTVFILSGNQEFQSGSCNGNLTSYPISSDTTQNLITPFLSPNSFAPFHLDSPVGLINFNGYGAVMADLTSQRQIGELVRWIGTAAIAGHADPSDQLAISWQYDGDIAAGYCNTLALYSYGKLTGKSCQLETDLPVVPDWSGWVSIYQMAQLYEWQDQFASFSYTQNGLPGASDPGTITIQFNGSGFSEASEADKQAVADFTSTLFAETNSPATFSCTLKANSDVTVFQRPSLEAAQFGILSEGETVKATMRTDDGWLGFDPATAQAANVGVFRLRWLSPDAAVSPQGSGCDGLTLAPPVSPTACYFMAMADTAVYTNPDTTSPLLATIPAGGYTAVTGQAISGMYRLDLQDGSLGQSSSGWLDPADANFNGPCDSLPTLTP